MTHKRFLLQGFTTETHLAAIEHLFACPNLTPGGLNNNIEASITLDLDLSKPSNSNIASNLENTFSNLTKTYPEHVLRIVKASELVALQNEGRLVDESASSPPRETSNIKTGKADGLSRIQLKVPPIFPQSTRNLRPSTSKSKSPTDLFLGPIPGAQNLKLVWKSKPLTERDLNIPSGTNTHATGSINLDKGLFEEHIDHRHYFRDEVFPALNWMTTNRPTVDEAFTKFGLVVKGVDYGEFDLRIGHTTSTESRAYQQRNAMTRLSWGPMI